MLRRSSLLFLFWVVLFSCGQVEVEQEEKSVEEIMTAGPLDPSTVVRSPVSATEPVDTVNVARMAFEEPTFDFGEVEEGEVVIHEYTFTNTGKVPLLISGARSTCGCTVPEWPKEAIQPEEEGVIKVRFNTTHKPGRQTKPVTITANTYPSVNKIFLTGVVRQDELQASQ